MQRHWCRSTQARCCGQWQRFAPQYICMYGPQTHPADAVFDSRRGMQHKKHWAPNCSPSHHKHERGHDDDAWLVGATDCMLTLLPLPCLPAGLPAQGPSHPHPCLPVCTCLYPCRQASPGRLSALEGVLFKGTAAAAAGDAAGVTAAAAAEVPLLAAVWLGSSEGSRVVGVAFLDAATRLVDGLVARPAGWSVHMFGIVPTAQGHSGRGRSCCLYEGGDFAVSEEAGLHSLYMMVCEGVQGCQAAGPGCLSSGVLVSAEPAGAGPCVFVWHLCGMILACIYVS